MSQKKYHSTIDKYYFIAEVKFDPAMQHFPNTYFLGDIDLESRFIANAHFKDSLMGGFYCYFYELE